MPTKIRINKTDINIFNKKKNTLPAQKDQYIDLRNNNFADNKKKYIFAGIFRKVLEWLKRLPWKGSIRVTVSRVRIPSFLLR